MFDFITRRRLILSVLVFFLLTIIVLLLTQFNSSNLIRHVLPSFSANNSKSIIEQERTEQQISRCYLIEPIEKLIPCQKCTSFQYRSKATGCFVTGYREYIQCKDSKTKTYRSCSMPLSVKRQNFWIFEGCIFIMGLLSLASVHSRQKFLDKQMVEKIKKQIGETEG